MLKNALPVFALILNVGCAHTPPAPLTTDYVLRNIGVKDPIFFGLKSGDEEITEHKATDAEMNNAQCRTFEDQKKYDRWVELLKSRSR